MIAEKIRAGAVGAERTENGNMSMSHHESMDIKKSLLKLKNKDILVSVTWKQHMSQKKEMVFNFPSYTL